MQQSPTSSHIEIGSRAAGWRRGRLAATIIIVTTVGIWATFPWWLAGIGSWTTSRNLWPSAPVDAIVVLAGDNGRLEEGIRLFHLGIAKEFWHTGTDPGVVDQAAKAKVPRDAMRFLRSNSTWEDAEQVNEAIRQTGAQRVLIVTSWYHGRRALRSVEKRANGRKVAFFHQSVAPLGYDDQDWWMTESGRDVVESEVLKSCYYLFAYGLTLR